MILSIFIEQNLIKMSLVEKGRVLDPAPFKDCASRKNQDFTVLKRCGVDSETFSYYHDLSEKLTPLEVSAIKRKGFIKRGKTVIYGELLTGLITSLDKLLKRNNIDTTAFNSFKIQGNTGKNSTSYKIAAAFIEGLRAGI